MARAILRLPRVKAKTGLSRSTLYLLVKRGSFPLQVQLGERAVGWIEEDVESWLTAQIQKSQRATGESQ